MKTLITAHSGAMETKANTLDSVKVAMEYDVDYIEVDIRVTRDRIPVLNHDEEIMGMRIAEYTLKDLMESVSDLTTLEDVMQLVKGTDIMLNLDMKRVEAMMPTAHMVTMYEMEDKVVFTGLNEEKANIMKHHFSSCRWLYNVEGRLDGLKGPSYMKILELICKEANGLSARGINVKYQAVTKEMMEFAAKRYLTVAVWTVDKEEDMQCMLDLGVSSITTHQLGKLCDLMK